jgi:hypothetical protein
MQYLHQQVPARQFLAKNAGGLAGERKFLEINRATCSWR